jgi:hypothetical protein
VKRLAPVLAVVTLRSVRMSAQQIRAPVLTFLAFTGSKRQAWHEIASTQVQRWVPVHFAPVAAPFFYLFSPTGHSLICKDLCKVAPPPNSHLSQAQLAGSLAQGLA